MAMPTSTFIRATFFALGAALGGGAVAVLNASKKRETPSTSTTSSKPPIDVGVTGDIRFSAGATTAVGPILKYGNPGTQHHVLALSEYHYYCNPLQAPFPTNSYAKRMWPHMTVECGILHGSVVPTHSPTGRHFDTYTFDIQYSYSPLRLPNI
jgi:hypothetical protein